MPWGSGGEEASGQNAGAVSKATGRGWNSKQVAPGKQVAGKEAPGAEGVNQGLGGGTG